LLSFGQILALAGDFYGVPSQPISDGANPREQQQRFQNAFNTLYTETSGIGPCRRLRRWPRSRSNPGVPATGVAIVPRQ